MKKPLFFLSISTVLLLLPQVSAAGTWDDLWLRHDQQGEHALKANKPSEAAKLFENPEWQGVAEYRSGQYNKALTKFSDKNAPLANYNRGNVLAQLGKYKEAIKAYTKALAQQENYPDAAHNIEVLKKLLNDENDQQSSSKQQKNDQQQQQKKNNDSSTGQDKQKNPDKQNPDQQKEKPQDQQSQNQKKFDNDKQEQDKNKNNQQNKNKENPDPKDKSDKDSKPQPKHANPKEDEKNKGEKKPFKPQAQQQQTPEEQELNQWLDRIPDDPSGLLRQKFLRDHARHRGKR